MWGGVQEMPNLNEQPLIRLIRLTWIHILAASLTILHRETIWLEVEFHQVEEGRKSGSHFVSWVRWLGWPGQQSKQPQEHPQHRQRRYPQFDWFQPRWTLDNCIAHLMNEPLKWSPLIFFSQNFWLHLQHWKLFTVCANSLVGRLVGRLLGWEQSSWD